MISYNYLYHVLFFGMSLMAASSVTSAELLIGNTENSSSSFTFTIGPHSFYTPQGKLFVGATQAVEGNKFALATGFRSEKHFRALAPEKVFLNGSEDRANPLFGASIDFLAAFGPKALVVKTGDPASLYLVDDISRHPIITMHAVHAIADAQGNATPKMLAIAAQIEEKTDVQGMAQEEGVAAFCAVANQSGNFNGNGAGIAYAALMLHSNDGVSSFEWHLYDAQTGTLDSNKAFPIDLAMPTLGINTPVSSIANSVDLHWDPGLARLYIGLQVQAGAAGNAGARGVLVASVTNGKIAVQPIAQDTAFDAAGEIVGALGSNVLTSIQKVRTIQTTTYLRYLVVVGGTGSGVNSQSVFALPLVDLPGSESHGQLANVTSAPADLSVSVAPFRFRSRHFVTEAQQPGDLFTASSIPALVGGNVLLPGPITDISAGKDAVFVSVAAGGNNQQAGIFYSQALFDPVGRIKAWTNWQRAGAAGAILGFVLDSVTGNFSYLPTADTVTSNTVLRTEWHNKQDSLVRLARSHFKSQNGGVQGLFDFSYTTPTFSTGIGSRISLLVMTGFKKIVLIQSGADSAGLFGPVVNTKEQVINCPQGNLANFSAGATALNIHGGTLSKLGPIITAEIASDNTYGWLTVGGSGGVAVLADSSGAGWLANPGLGQGFTGFTGSMQFQRVDRYKNVRKVVSSGNQLFILTTTKLDRISLSAQAIATGAFSPVTLAVASEILGPDSSFADLIISGPLALIGTSKGMLRSANQIDVQTAQTGTWHLLQLPEVAGSLDGVGPVSKLYAITQTGREQDVFNSSQLVAGNIHVLNSCIGYHQGQVYRLDLTLGTGSVTSNTITLFPDLFVAGQKTFFTNFGSYRNYIATDGAVYFTSNSRYNGFKPFVFILSPLLRSGQIESGRLGHELPFDILDFNAVGRMIRRSASGSWLIHGDFGIRANS